MYKKVESFGIMIDESTRGKNKQFVMYLMFWNSDKDLLVAQITHLKEIKYCSSEVIAKVVIKIIQASYLDIQNCHEILGLKPSTEQEIAYANQLQEDFKAKNYNDFGLFKKVTEDKRFSP
ncbi:37238_t:CDS:2 [Gigaspora margarita]|uniref:37238_t:CDS:1 n=1 Tax=Gigaspora margarita TaxID=4874 RepID=A0ABM8VXV6_GIGMA|nr:37238_t:CDS:2 [Gigaspora margarita]